MNVKVIKVGGQVIFAVPHDLLGGHQIGEWLGKYLKSGAIGWIQNPVAPQHALYLLESRDMEQEVVGELSNIVEVEVIEKRA